MIHLHRKVTVNPALTEAVGPTALVNGLTEVVALTQPLKGPRMPPSGGE